MSSTYSSSLRIELIGSGDQAGAWGSTTNSNLAYVLDTAIAGYQTVSVTTANQALTYVNGPSSSASLNQSVYAMLRFTTTTGAAFSVFAPPVPKTYIIYNNSGYTMSLKVSDVIGSTTPYAGNVPLTISNGNKVLVWSDGESFYDVQAQNLTGTLPIANGGTGQTTANAAFNALAPAQTSTVTAGNFIVGAVYTILTIGTTDFTLIGASSNTVGVSFTASGAGTGTGTATTKVPNRYLKSDGTDTSFDYLNLSDVTTVTAGSFTIGTAYTVKSLGTTNFVSIGAASTAVATGSVTTTVLTVTSVSSGSFAVGTYVTGTGISSGTYITSFGTGSGGAGTYNLNQAVGSPTGSITVTGQPIPGTAFVATGAGSGSGTAVLADFIGTLPVTNGGTGVTTSTGTGSIVLSTSPTFTTPRVIGSSTGYTTLASANSGATNYTATLPAENFTVGFRNIPAVGTKTSSYTLAVGDVGKYVQVGTGGSIVIPDSVFSEGDVVSIFNNTSGSITITCSITTAYISGVDADKASVSLTTRGVATVLFISGTVCVISGLVS